MTDTLPEAIERLYNTFAKYTAAGMHYCDCGCVDPAVIAELVSTPLREISESVITRYHGSAMYTIGDLSHYKHYLPRMCEVHAEDEFFDNYTWELQTKLAYAEWQTWPQEEQVAIQAFMLARWRERVNGSSEDRVSLDAIKTYTYLVNLQPLWDAWDYLHNPHALRRFVKLLYYEQAFFFPLQPTDDLPLTVDILLKGCSTKQTVALLEAAFFEYDDTDPEYGTMLSAIIPLVEYYW